MSWKSLFVKPDPNDESSEQKEAPASQPVIAPMPTTGGNVYVPPNTYIPPMTYAQPQPAMNEDFSAFIEELFTAMESANIKNSQDYMDLKNALKNLENLGVSMDESARFKAVFATMQASGCDFSALMDSFNYYKNILEEERIKFEQALSSAVSESVVSKQKQLDDMTNANAQKANEIKRLSDEISQSQQQISSLQSEIAGANGVIEQKKANFIAAYNKVTSELEDDRRKAQMYVGTVTNTNTQTTKVKKTTKK